MKAIDFFSSNRKLEPGQRWLFDNGELSYLAEICNDVLLFTVLAVIKPNMWENPWCVKYATRRHTSLLEGGKNWTYLEGQEAPK